MEQKTTQDPARLLRVQAVSAASKGLSPTLPIWVGVCARRQGLTAEQQHKRRARVCKHTRARMHTYPVARRATAGRQGDAGASSPWWGAGWGGHGCRHPRSGRRRVQPFHPGSARQGAHPPACSCPSLLCLVPASPAAAPAGFYGNSAGKHNFQQGHHQPQHPKSRQRAAPSRGLPGRHLCPALLPCPLVTAPLPEGTARDVGRVMESSKPGWRWWPSAAGWVPRHAGLASMGYGCWAAPHRQTLAEAVRDWPEGTGFALTM